MRRTRGHVEREDTDVVGDRIVAQLIDVVAMVVWVVAVAFVLGGALGAVATPSRGTGLLVAALSFLTLPLYGTLLEAYWNGQTVGKRLVGVTVVRTDGSACDLRAAFVRNLPAVALAGWLPYLVALASMASSDRRQRVFDRVAGTTVVDTRARG